MALKLRVQKRGNVNGACPSLQIMCKFNKKQRQSRQHTIYCKCVLSNAAHEVLPTKTASEGPHHLSLGKSCMLKHDIERMCMNRAQSARAARKRSAKKKKKAPIGTSRDSHGHILRKHNCLPACSNSYTTAVLQARTARNASGKQLPFSGWGKWVAKALKTWYSTISNESRKW